MFLSDLHHAACALRGLGQKDRETSFAEALAQADVADRYRKRTGKCHARGPGTLSGVFGPVDVPATCDRAYLEAMQVVVAGLLARSR